MPNFIAVLINLHKLEIIQQYSILIKKIINLEEINIATQLI